MMQINIPTASPSPAERVVQLLNMQYSFFRGFSRFTSSFKVEEIQEKWDLEETLQCLRTKWSEIESYHYKIDAVLRGWDLEYDEEYFFHEKTFEALLKALLKALNTRFASTSHLHTSTPKLDVPGFEGSYTQWPRKAPREIPTLEEGTGFLENNCMSLEPIIEKEQDTTAPQTPKSSSCQLNIPCHQSEGPSIDKNYQRNHSSKSRDLEFITSACTITLTCPYCKCNHAISEGDDFTKLNAKDKLNATTQLGICQNCLLHHEVGQCHSRRSCKVCQGQHNSQLHDTLMFLEQPGYINPYQIPSAPNDHKLVACAALDESFPKEYEKDTRIISQDEDHRKNKASILKGQYCNVPIKWNRGIMNNQKPYRRYIKKIASHHSSPCKRRQRRKAQRARAGPHLTARINAAALVEGPKASQHQGACDEQCVQSISRYKYFKLNVPQMNNVI